MRRVVYVAQRFPVVTETFTLAEVRGLATSGFEVRVRTLREPPVGLPDELCVGAPRVEALGSLASGVPAAPTLLVRAPELAVRATTPRRGLALLRGLTLSRDLGREDHVHVQFPLDAASAGLYAVCATGCSFSFSGHTLHRLDLMPEKLAAASFVTVGSDFERRVLAERYGERWLDRIHVRRLGVPSRDARAEVESDLVVAAGMLTGKKGHDVLLHAVARLEGVRLELIGDGPDRFELEALSSALGLGSRVVFHGALSHEQTLRAIGRAAAFALCCRETADGDHDCLPVALMDAMSIGVPCVSSRAFGIPELIEDERSGLLVPPGDAAATSAALHRLLANERDAAALGTAGRETVRERYDLDRNVAALAELFARHLR